jgi:hypothetical protein
MMQKKKNSEHSLPVITSYEHLNLLLVVKTTNFPSLAAYK